MQTETRTEMKNEVVQSVDEMDETVETQIVVRRNLWPYSLSCRCPHPDPCFCRSRIVLGRVHVHAPRIRDDHLSLIYFHPLLSAPMVRPRIFANRSACHDNFVRLSGYSYRHRIAPGSAEETVNLVA